MRTSRNFLNDDLIQFNTTFPGSSFQVPAEDVERQMALNQQLIIDSNDDDVNTAQKENQSVCNGIDHIDPIP